jgi:hypothetical protein
MTFETHHRGLALASLGELKSLSQQEHSIGSCHVLYLFLYLLLVMPDGDKLTPPLLAISQTLI